jgi:Zn-dependent peptidase ImmA (M78 family)
MWFGLYSKKVLLDYIENKVKELANKENIPIFNVSFDDMNIGVTDENEKSIGTFNYCKDSESKIEYKRILDQLKKCNLYDKRPKNHILPRIELSEKADLYTLIHELGHYFLYKRNMNQSEQGADKFIEEFFDNYLPPFFKWIYRIELQIRTKKELNFSPKEDYMYYKQYKEFVKNGVQ